MTHLDPMRALRIIHGMVLGADDEDKFLMDIYMISHQAASPNCAKNHPSFGERALEIERQLVEANVMKPWPLTEDTLLDRIPLL